LSLLERKSKKGSDNFQTPDWPVEQLIKFLEENSPIWNKNLWIWEPACGLKENIVNCFKNNGYSAFGSDISNDLDFLKDKATHQYDVIITNPPYSIKDQFLKRCYEKKVPFALLLPITAFEGQKRQAMYKEYGAQFLIPNKRINFETPSGTGAGAWFATMWVTWGFGLEKDVYFL